MKRTTIIGLVAVPVVIGGLYLLMVSGFLTLAAVLLVLAVVGMLATAVWDVRRGHRRGAALLTAGALVTTVAVGWYAWNLNDKLGDITRVPDAVLDEGERPPAPEEQRSAQHPADGRRQRHPAGRQAHRGRAPRLGRVEPG